MGLTLNEAAPRLSMAMLLAVPLVYALFLGASWLIKVDDVTLPSVTERPLGKITPAETLIDAVPPDIVKPPVLAEQPPPPVRERFDTKGGAPDFSFAAPDAGTFSFEPLKPPVVAVSTVAGRDIQVVRAPAPSIPGAAISRGRSGSCDVVFDVDTRGRPFNLTARCTDDIFRTEAIRAVSKAEFLPKIRNGVAVQQTGAIYLLEFDVQ